MARNAKYSEWLERDNLLLVQGWKRSGLSDEQIAKNIGISRRTFYNWINQYPQFKRATTIGKQHANFMVENALFKKAIEGNTTAMIFWLKNNCPDRYSDKTADDKEYTKSRTAKTKAETKYIEQNIDSAGDNQMARVDQLLGTIMKGTENDENKQK